MPIMLSPYKASPSRPLFSIDLFHNQVIKMTSADLDSVSPNNLTIHFHIKLKNENSVFVLHNPNPLEITFSYSPNASMEVVLAEYKVHSFYQDNLVERKGMPTVLEGTDMVDFRVDLVGMFRNKKAGAKRLKVKLRCVVTVNCTTSRKMLTGIIGKAKPGLDFQILESILE